MTTCVILQPSYIPWRGYFHQVQKADLFVFYDDVQYDRLGWRNRNRIKTPQGPKWLTIPVHRHGAVTEQIPINQIQICWKDSWNAKHWSTIEYAYHKTPFFQSYAPLLKTFYERHPTWLSDFTIELTIAIARELGIQHTEFIRSSALQVEGFKTDRLINILRKLGASHYISGPSARNYIQEEKFSAAGITLEYMEYHYPEYPQLYPPFDPQVTVLDLLFMTGSDARKYIYDYAEL
jgi:WbqC-like protein family